MLEIKETSEYKKKKSIKLLLFDEDWRMFLVRFRVWPGVELPWDLEFVQYNTHAYTTAAV